MARQPDIPAQAKRITDSAFHFLSDVDFGNADISAEAEVRADDAESSKNVGPEDCFFEMIIIKLEERWINGQLSIEEILLILVDRASPAPTIQG